MKNKLANVIDLEMDQGFIIEVGLTVVDLENFEIVSTYSMPIKPEFNGRVTDHVMELTGWTRAKLDRQGEDLGTVINRLKTKHGASNRLCVVDSLGEIKAFGDKSPFRPCCLNVSDLYAIKHKKFGKSPSLEEMLFEHGLDFVGDQHRADDDSFNIARLFIELVR